MSKHERYRVGTDFAGGYVVKAKIDGEWCEVARYDVEGGETFSSHVDPRQYEAIREFARRADIY